MSKEAWDKLIVALDLPEEKDIKRTVENLLPKVKKFKIGLVPYTACGPSIIQWIKDKGADVFLDLKFFDIPHTMIEAAKLLLNMKVWAFTVHLKSGKVALTQLKDKLVEEAQKKGIIFPLIVGVTELTSKDADLAKVMDLAGVARKSNLEAIICSVWEAKEIKEKFGLITITPGIRKEKEDDQVRIATVKDALEEKVDYFVIGRPIIKEKNPLAAAEDLLERGER